MEPLHWIVVIAIISAAAVLITLIQKHYQFLQDNPPETESPVEDCKHFYEEFDKLRQSQGDRCIAIHYISRCKKCGDMKTETIST